MQVCTLLTPRLLPQARVLAASLRRHQPSWHHELLLLGRPADDAAAPFEPTDGIAVRDAVEALDIEIDLETLVGHHDDEDLIALLIPRLLRTYADRDPEGVIHLPATAWALADLSPVHSALSDRALMLTPRLFAALPDDGLQPSNIQLEEAGRIDAGIIAVRDSSPNGFLTWWERLLERALGSLDGTTAPARPEDRPWLMRFLELAPARFSAAMLEDPGCNLSMWNLHRHALEDVAGATMVDGTNRVRLMSFAGFEPDRPHRLSPVASRVRISRSPPLRALCDAYAAELLAAGWKAEQQRGELGGRLPNGLVYDRTLHDLLGLASMLGTHIEDVFSESGCGAFTTWLEGPAPRGASHGITRYAFYRIARERPDVVHAFPDLDGEDGARYVRWCEDFGRRELSLLDRFMHVREAGRSHGGRPAAAAAARSDVVARSDTPASGNAPARSDASDAHLDRKDGGTPHVRVTGYLGHTLGLGAAARGYVAALTAAGVETSAASVPLHHLELPVELEAEYGRHQFADSARLTDHEYEIVAVNADELPGLVERLGDDHFAGRRIGIWGWETNSIPARWDSAFALVDEIWVYSSFMAENIGAVSPVPVLALPPPVPIPDPPQAQSPIKMPDGFLFLFVFDYLSTIQRKNPTALIEAFKQAFAESDGAQLLIKTINAPLRPLAEEELLWAAHGRSDIRLVDCSLASEELGALMASCDCYVSLHRSEGFGLTMAETMALGKPVIATGYSGNLDFMDADNSYLIDYEIGLVGPECEIYPADGEWAEPSVRHAAELMRHVKESPEEAAAKGRQARADIARRLSPEATGSAMRRRLEELSRSPARRSAARHRA